MTKHLLLIDDDDDEFDLLATIVNEIPSLVCSYAENGFKGIALMESLKPDLVFLDMNMPMMNGLECLKKIRQTPDLKNARVYIYSNSSAEDMKTQVMKFGATGCLTKPANLGSLRNILRNVIDDTFPGLL